MATAGAQQPNNLNSKSDGPQRGCCSLKPKEKEDNFCNEKQMLVNEISKCNATTQEVEVQDC
jgi:hypothetical protein